MPIYSPSQYECDNIKLDDTIMIKSRSILYKFFRKYFLKDKIKLKIKIDNDEFSQYYNYYQEDCIIIKSYEMTCVENLENQIPCVLSFGKHNKTINTFLIKQVIVTLYNVQFIFKNNISLTFPLNNIIKASERNKIKLNDINKKEIIEQDIKYVKYKGEYFKNKILENNITEINIQYCNICGKPIKMIFNKDSIEINNFCTCKNIKLEKTNISYDELSLFIDRQDKDIKQIYLNYFNGELKNE